VRLKQETKPDGRRLKTDDRQKKKTGLVGPVSRSNWFEAAIWLG